MDFASSTPEIQNEIKVTPAMIEAGVAVFYDLDMLGPGEEELRKAVTQCFLAMLQISLRDRYAVDRLVPEGPLFS